MNIHIWLEQLQGMSVTVIDNDGLSLTELHFAKSSAISSIYCLEQSHISPVYQYLTIIYKGRRAVVIVGGRWKCHERFQKGAHDCYGNEVL